MTPGTSGPLYTSDAEQVWTVLDGHARVAVDGTEHTLDPGDTLVLPPGATRRVHATDAFRALVAAPAGTRAIPADGEPVLPPWIA